MTSLGTLPYSVNLAAGWWGFLFGALSGALLGLFFHKESWLGGYGSFRRRLLRLGHIACFGVGLLNLLFALGTPASSAATDWVGTLFLVLHLS